MQRELPTKTSVKKTKKDTKKGLKGLSPYYKAIFIRISIGSLS
jgi:hypothetical protein